MPSSFTETLSSAGIECTDGTSWNREKILSHISSYDGTVIRSRIFIDKEFLDRGIHLKFIARAGAGMESIDTAYALEKGIACLSSPEGNRVAVAEHALGMLLCLMNNLHKADREIRAGRWLREENRGHELAGKTIGIIGYGNTGSAFAKRLEGFDVQVLAFDKYKKNFGTSFVKAALPGEIFSEADILSLHVPLTDETHYMVTDSYLSQFRKNIYLVNTSRGKVVNTGDLVRNLEKGKVKGACLDVIEYEDHSFESLSAEATLPAPMRYLFTCPNVLLSPHIAGWTYESKEKIAEVLAEKIKKFLEL